MKLTPQQRREVAQRYSWSKHSPHDWISEHDVANLEKAINAVLNSDPVGTVRRDPRSGLVAVRAVYPCTHSECGISPQPSWHYINEAGEAHHTRHDDCDAALRIAGYWVVIYQPEDKS